MIALDSSRRAEGSASDEAAVTADVTGVATARSQAVTIETDGESK